MPRCRTCNRLAAPPIPCEGDSFLCESCAAAALGIGPPAPDAATEQRAEEPVVPSGGEGPDPDR